jgi:ribosomal protein S21
MNNKDYVEDLKRKHNRRPRKGTAEEGFKGYEVEVRGDDVMKAYRVLERILKKERVLEQYNERQRYVKPSQRRHEENKRKKKLQAKENRQRRLEEKNNE